jgi:hypothetical protein
MTSIDYFVGGFGVRTSEIREEEVWRGGRVGGMKKVV